MKTCSVKQSDITKNWYVVDAEGQTLGRLASEISRVLRGKHKASFVPHLDCGDPVVVVNAEKVKLQGNKMQGKFYHSYSGYIGGLKTVRADFLQQTHPDRLITFAVKGMLPKNKLARKVIKQLKVYVGPNHPHTAQNPQPLPPRTGKED
jgi:large subunit ribosomal protein L13